MSDHVYLVVTSSSPKLVILRVPAAGEKIAAGPWKSVLRAFNNDVRKPFLSVKWRDVFAIERLDESDSERAAAAFNGAEVMMGFSLFDWRQDSFVLLREAVKAAGGDDVKDG